MRGRVQSNIGIAGGFQNHFGFSIGAVQPVIKVKGDEPVAGKELIKKWSSRETAY